ncbi:SpoIIE family protein phosphatase [Streptomyces sp. ISL-36]|uniref:SpoIIE family protein phosphatase n=1 Tax=Streptomyces sp. ISL-36 TaxID=2819182 RepID=UPI001BEC72AD|nr:SpoIIE family protein phosphatase [Streptomyces sp. ISL-36]MBT2442725.1 SpoIIE family protein phosphatase [Streptomyces sp. ISL-36]
MDALALVQTAARPADRLQLAPRYELTDRSALTHAFRTGRPLWLDATDLAQYGHRGSTAGVSMGVLPLASTTGRSGCLVVVGDMPDGFSAEQRLLIELSADGVAARLEGDGDPLDGIGAFAMALGSEWIEADRGLLALAGIRAEEFDGRVQTLLELVMPEDVPALTAIADAEGPAAGEREFRARRPATESCRLTLRYRFGGEEKRVLGAVAKAAEPRSDGHLSVLRPLSAVLRAALKADRTALAEVTADQVVVSMLDPPDATAWPEGWWPGREGPTEISAAAVPSVQTALETNRPTLWRGARADGGTADLEPELAAVGPGALALLPLRDESSVPALYLIGWDTPNAVDSDVHLLLDTVASHAGQALMRARAVKASLELATSLQRGLFPRTLPALSGGVAVARFRSATAGLEVGGDWYDVVPLPDSHVALVVGDVQGHSPVAATIMGQIRTAIRAYAIEGHPPDVVASHANRLLLGMSTDLFATCLYADLNMEDGSCWLVRAGHPRPLLRHPDGNTEEVAVEGGPPLGVLADAQYVMATIGLPPGSVLALLTDGLLESPDPRPGDAARRLREALSRLDPSHPADAADALLEGAPRRYDDAALLLFRYDGMHDKPVRAGATVWRLPDAVMHARRYVKRTLRTWGVGTEADDVMLIVSELVTNALVHTQGPVRFDLTLTGDRLRVAVSDSSPRTPVRAASLDWEATGGRGMLLVEAMAETWGSVPLSGGKQVWGEVTLASRPPVAGPAADGRRPR